ncbi:MAG: glycoside hydrolase family 3 C-terminal domain-containing protein [Phaeodactylibacter sp.]|nr:glycoside hydrolase family 3 C-terminal domain-containing protein [Phaeodactylibacter sp.]
MMKAYRAKARSLVQQMTLEEKAGLCSGQDIWATKPVERLGIPSIWMADGPTGLRKAASGQEGGLGSSLPATCFPTASALGASWDTGLIYEVGQAIGRECQAQDVQVLLAPGVNMKRSPLGGRNFEYFAEDPVLAGEIAAAFIRGVQSEGVGTSLKHFAVNNQEFERMFISAELDERTLREAYLPAFRIAIKKANPWTVMCAYNKVNGTYASEHHHLLHQILKEEWGYKGFVVSDWGAVNDRVAGIRAGLHLEMPSSGGYNDEKIAAAVRNGELAEARLDEVVEDLLAVILLADASRKDGLSADFGQHHYLARRVAAECMVLLKNEADILPLPANTSLAVIGRFAKEPRFQGAGSSQVVPTQVDTAWEELQAYFGALAYAPGYDDPDRVDRQLIDEACRAAAGAKAAVLFVGLPSKYESESFDRGHIGLPPAHNALVEAVARVQPNAIVVLTNGSAVSMPWHNEVKAILEGWLAGQGGGGAVADILSGKANPSGKLSETFPQRLEHNPSYLNWPGAHGKVLYGEGIFIGYRYYDTKDIEPLFPFGHGLSYTNFEYSGMSLSETGLADDPQFTIRVLVHNSGRRAGQEVVQLYVSQEECRLQRPEKELRAFAKVSLEPGSQKEVTFQLSRRDFAYFNPAINDWVVDSGAYHIMVGASSRDIRLKQTIKLRVAKEAFVPFSRYTPIKEWLRHPRSAETMKALMGQVWQYYGGKPADEDALAMMEAHFMDLPLVKLVVSSRGAFTLEQLDEMVRGVNGWVGE